MPLTFNISLEINKTHMAMLLGARAEELQLEIKQPPIQCYSL